MGAPPRRGMRPNVGLSPTTPHNDAGMRTEPPVSAPTANGSAPNATAAAAPLEDPPAMRVGSQGFRTLPKSGLVPVAAYENWSRFSHPRFTAPAAARRS